MLMGMPKRERPLGAEGKSEPQHTRSRILGAAATSYRHDDLLDRLRILPAEFKAAPRPPKGITGKELDIIKLTAQCMRGVSGRSVGK
uniref:Uncharacterized protein n=1 Tax=Noccaea caerulescens TaxID=107243 RepID=A0A1J3F280_NOCCA